MIGGSTSHSSVALMNSFVKQVMADKVTNTRFLEIEVTKDIFCSMVKKGDVTSSDLEQANKWARDIINKASRNTPMPNFSEMDDAPRSV